MTTTDRMRLLREKCAELGQAEAARRLGYSPSAINQALKGGYQGSLDNLLTRVEEVFGSTTVMCPILGEIPLGKCADIRRRPFAATNPLRVQLYRQCRKCGGKP
ncbi:MAG: helix-turn-helix transcriptional regulator [Geobacteraceae bacterium]|nr:helix-turn-helix transcriptional regulator [Geobacteraceae bacterium]